MSEIKLINLIIYLNFQTMAVNSKLLEVLPEGYGAVVLVGIGSSLVNMWMARNVGHARKEFSVQVCYSVWSFIH